MHDSADAERISDVRVELLCLKVLHADIIMSSMGWLLMRITYTGQVRAHLKMHDSADAELLSDVRVDLLRLEAFHVDNMMSSMFWLSMRMTYTAQMRAHLRDARLGRCRTNV